MILLSIFKKSLSKKEGLSTFLIMAILLIVSYTSVISYTSIANKIEQEKLYKTYKKMDKLAFSIVDYKIDHWSETLTGLEDLVVKSGTESDCLANKSTMYNLNQSRGWCGPYIKFKNNQEQNSYKNDAWGTALRLTVVSNSASSSFKLEIEKWIKNIVLNVFFPKVAFAQSGSYNWGYHASWGYHQSNNYNAENNIGSLYTLDGLSGGPSIGNNYTDGNKPIIVYELRSCGPNKSCNDSDDIDIEI